VRYRKPLFPGEVRCGGTVTRADPALVAVAAWIRDADDQVVTTGQLEFARR
jgi:acyl-coenzyme A thioesterase PaaI-like protein